MIICMGTTLAVQQAMAFDRFVAGRTNVASEVLEGLAGKAVNVAKVVHALGAQALLITFLGGAAGELIQRELDSTGVPHDAIPVAAPTRVCATAIDRSTGTITD